jgi:predicted enzyme related to lactoylglutathione lyase
MTDNTAQDKLKHAQIQYIEFLSKDIQLAKKFYMECFDWSFTDYGPDYTAFAGDYIDGGFTSGSPVKGSILVIIYSKELEVTRDRIIKAGGTIEQDIFSFPGGRRFHFTDPDGNELAVWSE